MSISSLAMCLTSILSFDSRIIEVVDGIRACNIVCPCMLYMTYYVFPRRFGF